VTKRPKRTSITHSLPFGGARDWLPTADFWRCPGGCAQTASHIDEILFDATRESAKRDILFSGDSDG
jgi:hypothetical protein